MTPKSVLGIPPELSMDKSSILSALRSFTNPDYSLDKSYLLNFVLTFPSIKLLKHCIQSFFLSLMNCNMGTQRGHVWCKYHRALPLIFVSYDQSLGLLTRKKIWFTLCFKGGLFITATARLLIKTLLILKLLHLVNEWWKYLNEWSHQDMLSLGWGKFVEGLAG